MSRPHQWRKRITKRKLNEQKFSRIRWKISATKISYRRFARKRSNQRNSASAERIPVTNVLSQTVEQSSANFQPQNVEQFYKEGEIQVGRAGSRESNDTATRLCHEMKLRHG
jgi:hypothetical protein